MAINRVGGWVGLPLVNLMVVCVCCFKKVEENWKTLKKLCNSLDNQLDTDRMLGVSMENHAKHWQTIWKHFETLCTAINKNEEQWQGWKMNPGWDMLGIGDRESDETYGLRIDIWYALRMLYVAFIRQCFVNHRCVPKITSPEARQNMNKSIIWKVLSCTSICLAEKAS